MTALGIALMAFILMLVMFIICILSIKLGSKIALSYIKENLGKERMVFDFVIYQENKAVTEIYFEKPRSQKTSSISK